MSDQNVVRRGCLTVFLVLLALVGALIGWVYLSLRPDPMPNVTKAAHSPTARAADQLITPQMDAQLAGLKAALPWATPLGTGVSDLCRTVVNPTGEDFLARETWSPVTCGRTVTLYAAFDGDLTARLGQLDTALGAAGWQPQNLSNRPGDHGLTGQLAYLHRPPDDPTPAEVAAAAARPNTVDLAYKVPITDPTPYPLPGPSTVDRQPLPIGGRVYVAQAPLVPFVDDGVAVHDDHSPTDYYLAWQPLPRADLAAAYPAHGAVLVITLSIGYKTTPPPPAPTPTPAVDPGYSPCYSGSFCP
ncbi:hypothetical protein OG455_38500 [Kitasatospora sp. NBC_01287]|uniref:hypothetical protein n=1 Tax=Kitasatospora sp. NBC_01287 TaxID=2903573 RepID=UPI0022555525|nr:hypothetical protein [Kitasatospora sp. NBC_01287]MCX4751327.1 hypothetical protein [Kitasatospora sp. NBC_01287]